MPAVTDMTPIKIRSEWLVIVTSAVFPFALLLALGFEIATLTTLGLLLGLVATR